MERSAKEGRQQKPKSRVNGEGEEEARGSRKRPDKKNWDSGNHPHSRPKGQMAVGGVGQQSGSYHRQRDVPPRFQTHNRHGTKQSASRNNPSGGKKLPPKDSPTNRWHQGPALSSMQQQRQTTTATHHHHRQMNDDGGWSRGSPAKGSGWSSKRQSATHGLPTALKSNDWRGSPEVESAAIWPVAEHRHQGSGGSGEVESWNTFSPGGQGSRQHSQSENWMTDEGNLSVGDNTSSQHSNSSPSPSSVNWHVGSDPTPNVQHELEPIEDDDELEDRDMEGRSMGDGDNRTPRLHQLGPLHRETPDREDTGRTTEASDSGWESLKPTAPHTTDSGRDHSTEPPHLPSSSSPSPCASDTQAGLVLRGSPGRINKSLSPSRDLDKTLEFGPGASSGPDSSALSSSEAPRVSQDELPGPRSSRDLTTPDSGGGVGLGMSVWKCRPSVGGSTSSINSAGSNSSWKSEGKNGYHPKSSSSNYSPRKNTRYDSVSSSVSSSSLHMRKLKKPMSSLDDALECLHSEPSGWGDLPSPKPTDVVDNGTEIWGVAPDDLHRKIKHSNGWGDGGGGKMGEGMMGRGGGGEWGDEGGGVMGGGGWPGGVGDTRGHRVTTPGTPGSQWLPSGSKDSWGKKTRPTNFPDNISKLMDMGFSHQMAEKYLKANGNDLSATVGDLLAVGVVTEEGSLIGISGGGRPIKKQPGGLVKGLPGGNHYFGGGTGSFMGLGTPPGGGAPAMPGIKDLYHSQSHPSLHAQQLQLLQMQQQYMALPSATVLGFQQLLSNQMSQLRAGKLQVTQQLQALKAGAGGSSAVQQKIHQLQQRLILINQLMGHISHQQKYPLGKDKNSGGRGMLDGMVKSVTPGAVGSQPLGRHTPQCRSKDMKAPGSLTSRSLSLPGGAHEHGLSLGMQGLSMNGHVTPSSISQSSARSVSRLQQIISGSAEDGHQDDKTKFRFPPQSMTSTPAEFYSSTSSPLANSTTTTTPVSTPFSPARSFTDIQEFRPGVPWQPRTLPTEPAQLYAKPSTSTSHVSRPELRTVQSEPVFQQYCGGGMTQPPVGGQRRPPSLNYNPPPSAGYRGRSTSSDQQWQSMANNTPSPFGVPPTPDSAFSTGTPITRRQQQGPPPSQHTFHSTGGGRGLGQHLSRPSALFPSPHSFSQAPGRPPSISSSSSSSSAASSDMRWGSSSRGKFPSSSSSTSSSGSGPPPASLTSSSSMWDSSVGPSSGIPSSSWSSLGLENTSASSSSNNANPGFVPTPSSGNEPAAPAFSSPPPPHTSSSSLDELTPGLSGAWDKGGLQSPKSTVLSPEPTFAEWKSGKKAHFKLPSNPPSSWLCLYNINSQVDEASLRDVCSEFGHIESLAIVPNSETAIVQYSSKEQAVLAKSGLDKSPIVCGVTVSVDFISEQKASVFITGQQQQQQHVDGGEQPAVREQWLSKSEPGQSEGPASGQLADGSHWDNMGMVGRFSQTNTPPTNTTSSSMGRDRGGGEGSEPPNTPWSNSGFLPGLTSPWSSTPATESGLFPSSSSSSSKQEPATMSSSPSLSTYLPNGLF